MSENTHAPNARLVWGRWRYSIIASLLVNPPKRGELAAALEELAGTVWQDPFDPKVPVQPGFSTIEAWYYLARDAADPIAVLSRKPRADKGAEKVMSCELLGVLQTQYADHSGWSYQLHCDNLVVVAESDPSKYGPPASESTVRRRMKKHGWTPKRRRRNPTPGQRRAAERLEKLEVRSFESPYVHAMWHYDGHESKVCRVVDAEGEWHVPVAFACLDDCSRLCCHMQWYMSESAQTMSHGLSQGFSKRGLPRSVLHDCGGAMLSDEVLNGLRDNGVISKPTLAYSPYQNGKQEVFWAQVEGRLLAMVESVESLTLDFLNQATQAWVELEYNRRIHSEIGMAPLDKALRGPSVVRPSPTSEKLTRTFTAEVTRTQRKSDGTVSIDGVRFEIPGHLATLSRVALRYRSWDLSVAWIVDPETQAVIATIRPLDKAKNADGRRRTRVPVTDPPTPTTGRGGMAPLMRKLMEEYAATGAPPAYLPLDESVAKEVADE